MEEKKAISLNLFIRSKLPKIKSEKIIKKIHLFKNKNYNFSIKTTFFVIDQLGESLNKILNLKKSQNYWRYILSPYVSWIVFVTLPIFLYSKRKKINTYYSSYLHKLIIKDFDDLNKNITNLKFNKEIFSLCLFDNKYKPKFDYISYKVKKKEKKNFIKKTYDFFIRIFIKKVYLIANLNLKNIVFHLFFYKSFVYSLRGKYEISTFTKNIKLREQIKINLKNNLLKKYNIEKLIQCTLPVTYLENLKEISLSINPEKYKFKLLQSSGELWANDYARILAATLKEQKCKTEIFQHGGAYGSIRSTINFFDKYLADKFYCFGPPLSKKEERTKSINLIRNNNINKSSNNRIILPLSLPSHLLTTISSDYAAEVFDLYLKDLVIFLKNLNESNLKKITLRLQPQPFNKIYGRRELKRYLSKKFKHIEIIEPMHGFKEDLKIYSLCIVTIDSTIFLETLCSNINFICFWRRDYNKLNNKFKKIYNRLYSSKLFYDDPALAARYLNENLNENCGLNLINKNQLQIYLKKKLCNIYHS
jgi:putative transferase (TIGR04331 family)